MKFRLTLLAALLVASSSSWAINKCTQKDGKVVYQDAPCQNTSASTEQVKTWGAGQAAPSAGGTTAAGFKRVEPNGNLQGPPEAKPLLAVYRRWVDAERLALSTPRIALAAPVANMQAINRETEALTVPACLDDARKALGDLTGKSVSAMIAFMRKSEVESYLYAIADRGDLVRTFESSIERAGCEQPSR